MSSINELGGNSSYQDKFIAKPLRYPAKFSNEGKISSAALHYENIRYETLANIESELESIEQVAPKRLRLLNIAQKIFWAIGIGVCAALAVSMVFGIPIWIPIVSMIGISIFLNIGTGLCSKKKSALIDRYKNLKLRQAYLTRYSPDDPRYVSMLHKYKISVDAKTGLKSKLTNFIKENIPGLQNEEEDKDFLDSLDKRLNLIAGSVLGQNKLKQIENRNQKNGFSLTGAGDEWKSAQAQVAQVKQAQSNQDINIKNISNTILSNNGVLLDQLPHDSFLDLKDQIMKLCSLGLYACQQTSKSYQRYRLLYLDNDVLQSGKGGLSDGVKNIIKQNSFIEDLAASYLTNIEKLSLPIECAEVLGDINHLLSLVDNIDSSINSKNSASVENLLRDFSRLEKQIMEKSVRVTVPSSLGTDFAKYNAYKLKDLVDLDNQLDVNSSKEEKRAVQHCLQRRLGLISISYYYQTIKLLNDLQSVNNDEEKKIILDKALSFISDNKYDLNSIEIDALKQFINTSDPESVQKAIDLLNNVKNYRLQGIKTWYQEVFNLLGSKPDNINASPEALLNESKSKFLDYMIKLQSQSTNLDLISNYISQNISAKQFIDFAIRKHPQKRLELCRATILYLEASLSKDGWGAASLRPNVIAKNKEEAKSLIEKCKHCLRNWEIKFLDFQENKLTNVLNQDLSTKIPNKMQDMLESLDPVRKDALEDHITGFTEELKRIKFNQYDQNELVSTYQQLESEMESIVSIMQQAHDVISNECIGSATVLKTLFKKASSLNQDIEALSNKLSLEASKLRLSERNTEGKTVNTVIDNSISQFQHLKQKIVDFEQVVNNKDIDDSQVLEKSQSLFNDISGVTDELKHISDVLSAGLGKPILSDYITVDPLTGDRLASPTKDKSQMPIIANGIMAINRLLDNLKSKVARNTIGMHIATGIFSFMMVVFSLISFFVLANPFWVPLVLIGVGLGFQGCAALISKRIVDNNQDLVNQIELGQKVALSQQTVMNDILDEEHDRLNWFREHEGLNPGEVPLKEIKKLQIITKSEDIPFEKERSLNDLKKEFEKDSSRIARSYKNTYKKDIPEFTGKAKTDVKIDKTTNSDQISKVLSNISSKENSLREKTSRYYSLFDQMQAVDFKLERRSREESHLKKLRDKHSSNQLDVLQKMRQYQRFTEISKGIVSAIQLRKSSHVQEQGAIVFDQAQKASETILSIIETNLSQDISSGKFQVVPKGLQQINDILEEALQKDYFDVVLNILDVGSTKGSHLNSSNSANILNSDRENPLLDNVNNMEAHNKDSVSDGIVKVGISLDAVILSFNNLKQYLDGIVSEDSLSEDDIVRRTHLFEAARRDFLNYLEYHNRLKFNATGFLPANSYNHTIEELRKIFREITNLEANLTNKNGELATYASRLANKFLNKRYKAHSKDLSVIGEFIDGQASINEESIQKLSQIPISLLNKEHYKIMKASMLIREKLMNQNKLDSKIKFISSTLYPEDENLKLELSTQLLSLKSESKQLNSQLQKLATEIAVLENEIIELRDELERLSPSKPFQFNDTRILDKLFDENNKKWK